MNGLIINKKIRGKKNMDYDKKIEEYTQRLKMIEQEYAMTMGRLKEVQEQKEADQEKPEGKKEKDK